MKSFSQNNNIEMHSKHNEGKSVITERFIRTFKKKMYKYMTFNIFNIKNNNVSNLSW